MRGGRAHSSLELLAEFQDHHDCNDWRSTSCPALLDGWVRAANATETRSRWRGRRSATGWRRHGRQRSSKPLAKPWVWLPASPGHPQAADATIGYHRPVEPPSARIARAFASDGPNGIAAHPLLREIAPRHRPLGGAVHLIGAVTPSGIAGNQHYMAVLAALLSHEGVKVWVHAVMDGQDTRPQGGIDHLSRVPRRHRRRGTCGSRQRARPRLWFR